MPLRVANSPQVLMDTETIEITAVELANLILYDQLDGCVCRNSHLAEGLITVLTAMELEVHTLFDEGKNRYQVWIER